MPRCGVEGFELAQPKGQSSGQTALRNSRCQLFDFLAGPCCCRWPPVGLAASLAGKPLTGGLGARVAIQLLPPARWREVAVELHLLVVLGPVAFACAFLADSPPFYETLRCPLPLPTPETCLKRKCLAGPLPCATPVFGPGARIRETMSSAKLSWSSFAPLDHISSANNHSATPVPKEPVLHVNIPRSPSDPQRLTIIVSKSCRFSSDQLAPPPENPCRCPTSTSLTLPRVGFPSVCWARCW